MIVAACCAASACELRDQTIRSKVDEDWTVLWSITEKVKISEHSVFSHIANSGVLTRLDILFRHGHVGVGAPKMDDGRILQVERLVPFFAGRRDPRRPLGFKKIQKEYLCLCQLEMKLSVS
jgi:hypothetical protein